VSNSRAATRTDDTRQTINAIVRQSLGLEKIDHAADFFAMGGDSITGMGVISRVNEIFSVGLTFEDVADSFSVETVVRIIEERRSVA